MNYICPLRMCRFLYSCTYNIMKKLFWLITALVGVFATFWVFALSFSPDTIFLNADTEESCSDIGWDFTEWYEEIYCTTTPQSQLTDWEMEKIVLVAKRIKDIIGWDKEMYTQLVATLKSFKVRFTDSWDTKRLSIAIVLLQELEMVMDDDDNDVVIPETCSVWFDWCNTCQVMDNGELACTKMACVVQEEPMCKVHEKIIIVADHTAECEWAGSMSCLLVQESATRSAEYMKLWDIQWEAMSSGYIKIGDIKGESQRNADGWTYFYSEIEGFNYIEWYEWTLLVEETHLEPADVPADWSSIEWTLKEIISIAAEIPETCTSWFDGCNTCTAWENGAAACTLMYCEEMLLPYCMDEWIDNTKATDYNSSRSNKSY